ncbi:hypothetical protein AKG37_13775 [Bacillus australimaris]|uniref:DUF3592 domain-containing protein n=1 Tax=Bacillus australimaris TaxID=1326968 RepID=A0ABD4QNI2_9BACI|nr:hypothetical protein [Bacillus australimaris]KPN12959.1 hypothetical protein AKG37_13775 [Bacillus australimaris]MBR8691350.1 hypothetical protein [Bacillus australimaris]
MKGSDQVKRLPVIFLRYIVFFIPAIILSVMVWNHYQDDLSDGKVTENNVKRIFTFDEGERVVSAVSKDQQLHVEMYDPHLGKRISGWTAASDPFQEMWPSIQGNNLLLAFKNKDGQLIIEKLSPNGEKKELAQQKLKIPSFLNTNTYQWNGRLVFTGEMEGAAAVIGELKNGQFYVHNLNELKLPARPVSMDAVMNSFRGQTPIPIFEVSLKNDQKAYVSGISNEKHQLGLYVSKNAEPFSLVDDAVEQQLQKTIGSSQNFAVAAESEYPKRARKVKADGRLGEVVPTPKPIYQTYVYQLNEEEVLIAGSTAKDEAKGKLTGYIYNHRTNKAVSASKLFQSLSYESLQRDELSFNKNVKSNWLYYSFNNQLTGAYETKSSQLKEFPLQKIISIENASPAHQTSFDTFTQYVMKGGPLILNWAIWLFIPLLLFVLAIFLPPILRLVRKNKIKDSVTLQAYIVSVKETGTYINEQPVVSMRLQFEYEGQSIEKTVKTVVSYTQIPQPGQRIVIHYDPKKQKAMLLKEGDFSQPSEPKFIKGAVLRKIESYGTVGRGTVLSLTFELDQKRYVIPMVQAAGFDFRTGEKADLVDINGQLKMAAYGYEVLNRSGKDVTLTGIIQRVKQYPVAIHEQKPVQLDVTVSSGDQSITKTVTQFIPDHMQVAAGTQITIQTKKEELERENALLQEKQGSAKVSKVEFAGVVGNLPLANIQIERNGMMYEVKQPIDPITSVLPGDELWVAYHDMTRQAVIVKYASI